MQPLNFKTKKSELVVMSLKETASSSKQHFHQMESMTVFVGIIIFKVRRIS